MTHTIHPTCSLPPLTSQLPWRCLCCIALYLRSAHRAPLARRQETITYSGAACARTASLIHKAAVVIVPIMPVRLSEQECGVAIWLRTTSHPAPPYTLRWQIQLCVPNMFSHSSQQHDCLSWPSASTSDWSSSISTLTSTTTWYLCWQSWNQKVSALCLLCRCIWQRLGQTCAADCFYITAHSDGDSCGQPWQCCCTWCGSENMGHSNFKPISWLLLLAWRCTVDDQQHEDTLCHSVCTDEPQL